ncbi:MAG: hypothetical protein V4548_12125 [Bacteroidota bacterium]
MEVNNELQVVENNQNNSLQLNQFEDGLKQVLALHSLPTDGVFVDVNQS